MKKAAVCAAAVLCCTDDAAMELLQNVSQPSYTRWSAVYDLEDLSLTVCFDRDKEKTWSFSGRE